jgi:MoaA/NifB/PqqE/SkfB family radical SAM enzyme
MVFTGGEALLRPDMIDILTHAVGLGIEVELLTNGLDIDDNLAEQIVSSGTAQVTLSYDASTPETHDRFRGESGYHRRTTAAINALAHHRTLLKQPLKLQLKTVISNNNLGELVEIARFAEAGGLHIRFQPIEENYAATPDPAWYLKSDLWINDIPLLQKQVSALKALQAAGALIDNGPHELESYVRYFENPEAMMAEIQAHEVGRSRQSCMPAVSSFVISGNGDVSMCHMMEPIGNLAVQGPQQIWERRPLCWKAKCGFR